LSEMVKKKKRKKKIAEKRSEKRKELPTQTPSFAENPDGQSERHSLLYKKKSGSHCSQTFGESGQPTHGPEQEATADPKEDL